jgi:DNA primase
MSDEPLLCFDGDNAGRRAAYRAVDMALPRLVPGKSLLFASLPEGQDPDDLVRSGGSAAVAEVLRGARPLAEMLWTRETETAHIDTPERRAGLEARLNQATAVIAHESVRKYYRQDLETRLRQLFQPQRAASEFGGRGQRSFQNRGARGDSKFAGRGSLQRQPTRDTLGPASARLSASSIVRGGRSALPPREALILFALLNHPWLLETHAEELVELEFLHPDADRLRRAILDAVAGHEAVDTHALRAAIEKRNLGTLLVRLETPLSHGADWPARPDAAPEDVRPWWTHIVALHRKSRSLNKELREAERALAEDASDANLGRLRDVQEQLSSVEGTESTVEGFGALSGRKVRGL